MNPIRTSTIAPAAIELGRLGAICESLEGVWRSTLSWGDRVVVVTLNSVYTLNVIDQEHFVVTGGWFERNQSSPSVLRVSGSSWGGSAINRKLIASPGLYLEFGNGIVTTEVQKIYVTKYREPETEN